MLSWLFIRFIDILLLISLIYTGQKYIGNEITINIEEKGNFFFMFTLSSLSFLAGMGQARMDFK